MNELALDESDLDFRTAEVFAPLLQPARYKGAHGGRGSGKSHFFAELGIDDALRWPYEAGEGLRLLSGRQIQKSLKESAKALFEAKLAKYRLGEAEGFKVYSDRIGLPKDGLIMFTGMQDHTADSVKSLEGFHRAWIEEAQSLTDFSFSLLRPTIRWEDAKRGLASEIWASWNPRRKTDAIDKFLRANKPKNAIVVRANYDTNPWFTGVLEEERLNDFEHDPEGYAHIWLGEYATAHKGAYFTKWINQARQEGRIGKFSADHLLHKKAYWDIGVSDHGVVWVCQRVGQGLRVIDHHEATGQPVGYYLDWLRSNGHGAAECVLPHDSEHRDAATAIKFIDHVRKGGFQARSIANQGRGAAMKRVTATRNLFNRIEIDAEKCAAGLEALGFYHERKDESRDIGLGPEHDWSSHSADAFGLMCSDFEPESTTRSRTTFKPRSTA